MNTVEISDPTFHALQIAARLTNSTPSAIVEKLVADAATPSTPSATATSADDNKIGVFADYNGERFRGLFDPQTASVTLTSGRLAGTRYKSPSAAARGVVESERPDVDSNRNGWTFWTIDDGSKRLLDAVRQR